MVLVLQSSMKIVSSRSGVDMIELPAFESLLVLAFDSLPDGFALLGFFVSLLFSRRPSAFVVVHDGFVGLHIGLHLVGFHLFQETMDATLIFRVRFLLY